MLGETGVGKSTFINAFANYLNFGELKDAEENEPICLIPTSFVITSKSGKRVTVKLGEDDNESKAVDQGHSATQMCREYAFTVNNTTVRFIDTPGMGDTRGFEQDKYNVANILSFIGAYDFLHAICILLKPNNARLTPSFEFVITQLLSQLEKSASKNIIFIYTNARSTFYSPGDTAVPLEEVLKNIKTTMGVEIAHSMDENVFCLDNEAFRFMLAVRDKVEFADAARKTFADSWETSVKECERLMKYIACGVEGKGLEPHQVKNTISINEARNMISALRKPAEEIVENIGMNVNAIQKRKEDIEKYEGDIKDLESKLAIPIVESKTTELNEPQTVCTSEKCRKYTKLSSGEYMLRYPQVCCDPCFPVPKEPLWGLLRFGQFAVDYLGALYLCQAFDKDGDCTKCGCSFKEHSHVYYKTDIIEREDLSLKELLDESKSSHQRKMNLLNEMEKKLNEYEVEKNIIMKTTAQFAHFLKNNAIIPYNDSFERYIKLQMANEEAKPQNDVKEQNLQRYESMLTEYKEMKEHWENVVKSGVKNAGNVSTENIFQLIKELYELPIYGNKIREAAIIQNKAYYHETHRGQVVHRSNIMNIGERSSWTSLLSKTLTKMFQ